MIPLVLLVVYLSTPVLMKSIPVPSPLIQQAPQSIGFLKKYGYLPGTSSDALETLYTQESVEVAIKQAQRFGGLEETGRLNDETIKLFSSKRCGLPDVIRNDTLSTESWTPSDDVNNHNDHYHGHHQHHHSPHNHHHDHTHRRKKRFILTGSSWKRRHLKFYIKSWSQSLSQSEIVGELQKTLNIWGKYANLQFTRTLDSNDAEITVGFYRGQHGDMNPFDGRGNVLAHAFFPDARNGRGLAGDVHFDDDEAWGVGRADSPFRDTVDFTSVALHELGHSLGLHHSPVQNSVMSPYYRGKTDLGDDDVKAMYELYVKRNSLDDHDEDLHREDEERARQDEERRRRYDEEKRRWEEKKKEVERERLRAEEKKKFDEKREEERKRIEEEERNREEERTREEERRRQEEYRKYELERRLAERKYELERKRKEEEWKYEQERRQKEENKRNEEDRRKFEEERRKAMEQENEKKNQDDERRKLGHRPSAVVPPKPRSQLFDLTSTELYWILANLAVPWDILGIFYMIKSAFWKPIFRRPVGTTFEGDDESVESHKQHDSTHTIPPIQNSYGHHDQRYPSAMSDGCSGGFSAATNLRGELFFVKENTLWRLSRPGSVHDKYPVQVQRFFHLLPEEVKTIDAMYERERDSSLIIFSGRKYWEFDGVNISGSRLLQEYGLPHDVERVDAITSKNGQVHVFSGNRYWRLNDTALEFPLQRQPPRPISTLRGLPDQLDAALTYDDVTYFFKDDRFWYMNHNSGEAILHNSPLSDYWIGC